MTTQIPYDSAPAQPMPAYPTSPPWAAAPAVPDPAEPPPVPHGQLMVPYPELMHRASRPEPPSWAPVAVATVVLATLGTIGAAVVCTFVFGVVGGILLGAGGGALGLLGASVAARRARRAKQARNPRYPYWLAFGLSLVAAAIPGLIALNVTARVVQSQVVEPAAVHAIQSTMVHGGRINTAAGVTVQSAACTPATARQANGLREYTCVVTLSSGQSGTLRVTADRHGRWTPVTSK